MFNGRYFCQRFYPVSFWAKVGAAGGILETIGLGDLTTAMATWLLGFTAGDRNTEIRDRLAVHYTADGGSDATTLLSRFLTLRA